MELNQNDQSIPTEEKTDGLEGSKTVSYETFQKSVTQERNLRERFKSVSSELEELKSQLAKQNEEKLKEQNEYKTLYENARSTINELKKEKDTFVNQMITAKRINAFEKVAGKLKHDDLYKLVPIDEIVIEDNEEVNLDSVELVAKKIRDKFGDDFFQKKEVGKLPNSTAIPEVNFKSALKNVRTQKELDELLKTYR